MSDDLPASVLDVISQHRQAYLESGGAEGHIMDITGIGGRPFTTHCLIRYIGRKSGRRLITPLIYGDYAGEVAIVGSKGGAAGHPNWYLNLIERPEVDFQIATQAFRATWREPEGEERARLWQFLVDLFPSYAQYQARTERTIPIVLMKAVEPIPVFREED